MSNLAIAVLAGAVGSQALRAVVERLRSHEEQAGGRYEARTEDSRSEIQGVTARWAKPVVISTPGLADMAQNLREALGCEIYPESAGPTLVLDRFKSGDIDLKFNWQRIVGRKVVFLFDTMDQERLFEQLSILQALQGFAIPDSDDKSTKWKTYVSAGRYCWGRAASVTVVLPWYRPCQMERTSRWHPTPDGKWTNANPEGAWLDVPTALYYARLLSTPGSVPPLPGPSDALDGMPLNPLWRPPLELLFVELHEEVPVGHSVSDLNTTIRMERFVPYFLEKLKKQESFPGKESQYVLFPDRGAYDRYAKSVFEKLGLEADHVLYITKVRVGETIEQTQKLFFDHSDAQASRPGEKESFARTDHVLIVDDFTNSGSTLFGAANLVQKMAGDSTGLKVTIFVSHLVATYQTSVVESIAKKLEDLGPECRFCTTNSIPVTTNVLKGHKQVEILDISNFVAELVMTPSSRL